MMPVSGMIYPTNVGKPPFAATTVSPTSNAESQQSSASAYHQWPWRALAFASDLGTIGCLIQKPRLGLLGWALAAPYYLAAIFTRPTKAAKQDEFIYQVTANGVFPFLAAKIGVSLSKKIYLKLLSHYSKFPGVESKYFKVTQALGGLLSLLILTPRVGDPMSAAFVNQNQKRRQANSST